MSDEKKFSPKIDFNKKDLFEKRTLHKKIKKNQGRTLSQQRWLNRQLNDPYVAAAKKAGYRSRAAFKLLEINEECRLLKPGMTVVDLGAAPGGWSQVTVEQVKSPNNAPRVFALDINEMEPVEGVHFIQGDFLSQEVQNELASLCGSNIDGIVSDMAAPATGHRQTDHIKTMALAEMAYEFARQQLAPGGFFIAKVLRGGD